MKHAASLTLCLLLALSSSARAEAPATDEGRTWHRLVGILQYLQADYPAAVSSQSEFELTEQKSFAAEALAAAKELGPAAATFVPRVEAIQARVNEAKDPEGVSRDCGELVESLVLAGGLARSPRVAPDLEHGKKLFQANCTACHGAEGKADVAIAANMEPQPANFHDPELMEDGLTPYKAFNTTSFGVPGTAMPAFPTLTEDDRWSLAFFVFTLRQPPCQGEPPNASLERLATSTDAELAKAFGAEKVACLRRNMPDADEEKVLLNARAAVGHAMRMGAEGDYVGAKNALLDAYLNGLEPVEPKLRGRDPALTQKLEEAFMQARLAAERKSPHLQDEGRELLSLLDQARKTTGSTTDVLSVAWLTLLILLREGFEATIIVTALLAALKKMKAMDQVRVVHAGWVSALIAGALAYIVGRKLLAGAQREWLEGVTALVAVAMLLYAALWLNARANVSHFMGELRQKMQGALGRGSTVGLFVIAFTSVLRESFETAIFLQGLAVDSAAGVVWGVVAGVVALAVLVLFVNRMGYRLPMKTLFNLSTVVMVVTAVMLLGKGIHSLQEVGALPLVPVRFIYVDMLGLYPDALSLVPQALLAVAPLVYRALRRRPREETPTSGDSATPTQPLR
ncbi:FTR1 family cytochrome c family protein/iron permease [Corallococcus coralloides DSM 2259]|uniref:FTR1 family cytochrome c family protein/iron permease n=1 Tax=Corallococcus coralloides (strain ATCC 25202 / DSM 2259 / NBRC 100086 / M2) TaxID=1144275 RepID=H8MT44_CORCM|nr:FTR1 family protein [Corallococcus coralloides]AFE11180.1 FTR1 family cytochrome c family protein/iron permease [Corallococcus coralloides DSM 2259]